MYGTPAPSAESQHPEAWPASTYGHLRGVPDNKNLLSGTLPDNKELLSGSLLDNNLFLHYMRKLCANKPTESVYKVINFKIDDIF